MTYKHCFPSKNGFSERFISSLCISSFSNAAFLFVFFLHETKLFTKKRQEPIHRQQIHKQIEHSRRLRSSLEDAVAAVEALSSSSPPSELSQQQQQQEAMNILQSSLPQMLQLEKLTKALEGRGGGGAYHDSKSNWCNDDYCNSTGKIMTCREEEKLEKKQQQMERDQRIIRQYLLEFVRESNSSTAEDDKELLHDSLTGGWNVTSKVSSTAEMMRKEKPVWSFVDNSRVTASQRATLPKPTTLTNKTFKRGSTYSLEDQPRRKRGSHDYSNATSRMHDGHLKFVQEGEKKREKPSPGGAPQDDLLSGTFFSRPPAFTSSHTSASNNKAAAAAPTKNPPPVVSKKAPKPRRAKQCHDCKTSTNRHRVCNYWKLSGFTGFKCGKVFCIDCLRSKYSVGDDVLGGGGGGGGDGDGDQSSKYKSKTIDDIVMNSTFDSDWHCPSCLGTCLCDTCVVQRKREGEREKNRGEGKRKSQRRTTAHSSYYNFF
jgi:hypothetical protein